jgi:protease-4
MKYFLKLIRNIFLFLLKQIVGTIITIALIIFLISALVVGLIDSQMPQKPVVEKDSYVSLSFPRGIEERLNFDWRSMKFNKELDFYTVIQSLDEIRNDKNIRGVILDLDNMNLASSQIEEIGEKLDELKKSDKKVYAFGNYINRNNYSIALYADEIYMTPSFSTSMNLEGYRLNVPYYKEIAEKFGVEFQVVHIGDFKSFGENFVKNEMSDEFRENYTRLLDASFNDFVDKISNRRKIGRELLEEKILGGDFLMLDSKSAQVEGLIDKLAFLDDFYEENEIENTISIEEYYTSKDKFNFEEDRIGVIVASGEIRMQGEDMSHTYITPDELSYQIDNAIEDDSIKGVVLRIDSPGGSALASEIIVEKLTKLKEKKPIYVSMGSVAASGGYYIASNANKIFANERTITGSIGVVSMIFNLENLYKKIGLKWETIEKGKTLSFMNLNKKLTEEEIELIRKSSEKTYVEFKKRVIEGRGLDAMKVEEIAQGKVWTGKEAKDIGLVDEIGSMETTVETMAMDLNLLNYDVVDLGGVDSKWDILLEFSNYLETKFDVKIFGHRLSEVEERMKYIEEINGKVQYRLPYDISI